jgi:hypothetical protein
MFQDLLRQVPQWALVAFLGISDEFTSAEVLGTFQTNHPSFFVLARQFSGKLTIPSIGYSKSFFFATPNGVLSTTGYIDERVAARTVWSAIHLIQALLGDMLLQYCVLRENMVVEPHIPRLRASFAHIELYLVPFSLLPTITPCLLTVVIPPSMLPRSSSSLPVHRKCLLLRTRPTPTIVMARLWQTSDPPFLVCYPGLCQSRIGMSPLIFLGLR